MASQNAHQINPKNPTRRTEHVKIEVGQLQRVLDTPVEAKQWDRCSIYRVPPRVQEQNEKMYRTQMVSIGPYHHGQPHLKPMEEHKVRALRQFLERSGKTMDDLKQALRDDTSSLMDSYEDLDAEWLDKDKFLELMILDACFILEFVRSGSSSNSSGYSESDPVFGIYRSSRFKNLYLDILKLENQIPFLVLEKLLTIENLITTHAVEQFDIFLGDDLPKAHELYQGYKPMHLLDCARTKMIGRLSIRKLPKFCRLDTRSASIYKKAGIVFKQNKTHTVSAIKLQNNVVELAIKPVSLQRTIRANLQVYETLHCLGNLEIHSYFRFMGDLIRSAEDARLLGLIDSITDEGSTGILNLLEFIPDGIGFFVDEESDLLAVVEQLNKYHKESTEKWKRRFREWRLNLKETYFKSPWTVLSLFGALLLLTLTIFQTVLSALSYYNPSQ
ncbi:UPF0481 protein At3g47200-like [Aristolochia californica]|uniref:UPF0481 protein At3g47200-like n=1 Tax=Aristolochia californica TaxID=171875 RepID=UPI0035DE8A60